MRDLCLWSEIKRAICEIRPRYAIVENVAALTVRGIDTVFADLAEVGYDGQWHCIPASALGAVHHRDRVWIIAYPRESGRAVAATIYVAIADRCHPPGIPGEGVSVLAQVSELRLDEPLPDVRKYDGIPETVDRIGAVGNSIYPEIAEIIGLAILEAENYS